MGCGHLCHPPAGNGAQSLNGPVGGGCRVAQFSCRLWSSFRCRLTAWTPDLEKELAIRRPALHAERRDAAVKAALEQMADTRRAEAEARQARALTPEQVRAQQMASKNEAAAAAARDYFGVTA